MSGCHSWRMSMRLPHDLPGLESWEGWRADGAALASKRQRHTGGLSPVSLRMTGVILSHSWECHSGCAEGLCPPAGLGKGVDLGVLARPSSALAETTWWTSPRLTMLQRAAAPVVPKPQSHRATADCRCLVPGHLGSRSRKGGL